MRDRFHRRMARHLSERYAKRLGNTSQAELRRLVVEGIEEALALGIKREWDLQTYLEYYVELGPGLTGNRDYPEIQALFSDQSLDSGERMYELRRRAIHKDD